MTATNAIVAQRIGSGSPDTDEIRALAAAAGHRVVDGELTPSQHHDLSAALPDGTRVHDRYRLVLAVFGDQAGTRRAQLQVELARLKYDLPRMRESADASDSPNELREKLRVSLDVLDTQDIARETVVTVLNKIDRLDAEERAERLAAAAEVAPSPMAISAREGTNLDRLVARIGEGLPTERATIEMANRNDAMAVISWLYDHASVADVSYEAAGDRVAVAFAARPSIVERARAKAADVGE